VAQENRSIGVDSPWKRGISRNAEFLFKIKSRSHRSVRLTEAFKAIQKFYAERSTHYIRQEPSGGSERGGGPISSLYNSITYKEIRMVGDIVSHAARYHN
jgi:hypothetical protein